MIRPILACINPYEVAEQSWGDMAFEVIIGGYRFMIAAVKGNGS